MPKNVSITASHLSCALAIWLRLSFPSVMRRASIVHGFTKVANFASYPPTFHQPSLTLPSHVSSLPFTLPSNFSSFTTHTLHSHFSSIRPHFSFSLSLHPTHFSLSLFALPHSLCPLTFHPSTLILDSNYSPLATHFAFPLLILIHSSYSLTFHPLKLILPEQLQNNVSKSNPYERPTHLADTIINF